VSFFFDGLADPMGDQDGDDVSAHAERRGAGFLDLRPEGLELAEVFPRIGRGDLCRQVLDLVRAMATRVAGAMRTASCGISPMTRPRGHPPGLLHVSSPKSVPNCPRASWPSRAEAGVRPRRS